MEDLLTAQETAEILKVKKSTVYEMIKRGDLPSHKIGKQLRIRQEDVQNLFAPTPPLSSTLPQEPVFMRPASPLASRPTTQLETFVLCGQDVALDLIAGELSIQPGMPQALRSQKGSYNGLVDLYRGHAQAATAHLWDEQTGTYNLPYIQKLLPATDAVVVRLFGRTVGFYTAEGNPRNLRRWEDLRQPGLVLANREPGGGMRVLLDEKLRTLHLSSDSLDGYYTPRSSHLSVAGAVASGEAHVGLGIGRTAQQVRGVEFVPLQREWYDLVFLARQQDEMPFRVMLDFISSERFMLELSPLGDYDFSETGRIFRV
ncbi:helix-turn-helix transcriptional regulator [Oscillospiraceae bacterium MB08-C2-2]|nr:helix-turn-helix transcriptional regulator [Oscillospiraceae bacterium MB08-C2-2]